MTHTDLVVGVREVVENYWRIRAALRLLAPAKAHAASRLQFEGIPQVGSMTGLLQRETIAEAHASLEEYATNRLSRDMFIALLAVFEKRLIACLRAAGSNTGGTLGSLQFRVQTVSSVPAGIAEDLDEVRERRNAQMHQDGRADQKYVDAASKVHARFPGHVAAVAAGTFVIPDGSYLTYAADVLVRYSAVI
jgi:hypothetical protein